MDDHLIMPDSRCDVRCVACMRYDWDFFHVPEKHFTGGVPECVLELGDGDTYDDEKCICTPDGESNEH